jgi:hypothetical protein
LQGYRCGVRGICHIHLGLEETEGCGRLLHPLSQSRL